jgi:hypothetical protein
MSNPTVLVTTNRGGGYVIVNQHADDKQLSPEAIEKFVTEKAGFKYKLLAVNNATDTRKANPRMREHNPDSRVYTLVLASKLGRKKK